MEGEEVKAGGRCQLQAAGDMLSLVMIDAARRYANVTLKKPQHCSLMCHKYMHEGPCGNTAANMQQSCTLSCLNVSARGVDLLIGTELSSDHGLVLIVAVCCCWNMPVLAAAVCCC